MRSTLVFVVLTLAGVAASSPSAAVAPCSTTTARGATVQNWCGPARATVMLGGKKLLFKGGVCGKVQGLGDGKNWSLNVGKFTVPPSKPRFAYFGVAGVAKAGTYQKGEFLISFTLPGKEYSVLGGPGWGLPWTKVTVGAGGRKGTFTGHAFLGTKRQPVTGSWSC